MDKDLLFKPRLPEADVELAGVGTVRVRGLNRDEAMAIAKMDDIAERDRHMVAMGMVDPSLSVSEVKQWAKAAPGGEIEKVSRAIHMLSGLGDDSFKEAYKSFSDES